MTDTNPIHLTMDDQLTLVTDTGHLDGNIRQVWAGPVNLTNAIREGDITIEPGTVGGTITRITLTLNGPIEITPDRGRA